MRCTPQFSRFHIPKLRFLHPRKALNNYLRIFQLNCRTFCELQGKRSWKKKLRPSVWHQMNSLPSEAWKTMGHYNARSSTGWIIPWKSRKFGWKLEVWVDPRGLWISVGGIYLGNISAKKRLHEQRRNRSVVDIWTRINVRPSNGNVLGEKINRCTSCPLSSLLPNATINYLLYPCQETFVKTEGRNMVRNVRCIPRRWPINDPRLCFWKLHRVPHDLQSSRAWCYFFQFLPVNECRNCLLLWRSFGRKRLNW